MPSVFPTKMFPKSEQTELDNYKLQVEILQQKLAKSEEQRQQFEEKFEKIQKKRAEHEKSIKVRSRGKFEEFLEKQRERNERNKKIIRMLEHIDQQAALLSQRSSRLKAMKRQYELYFARLLQSQTLRIQQSPRYSFLPINQYAAMTQPHQLMPYLDSKEQTAGYSPMMLSHSGNMYPVEDLTKQNIPSIVTMPATPPFNNTPRGTGSIQPSSQFGTDNWTIPNMNYTLSNLSNSNPNYAGNTSINSGFAGGPSEALSQPYKNNFNYNLQPNQFDYYNRTPINNTLNPIQNLTSAGNQLPQSGMVLAQWGTPNQVTGDLMRSTDGITNPYADNDMRRMSIRPESNDPTNIIAPSQKSISPNQRTFRDFDRGSSGHLSRANEKNPSSNEYNIAKATEEDLNLLRGLSSRNRMRTFNSSNETLSQQDLNQDAYSYSRKDPSNDPEATSASRIEPRQRSPSIYSISRSPSSEDKILSPSSLNPQGDDTVENQNRREGNELSPSRTLTTQFSKIQIPTSDNVNDEDEMNVKLRDPIKLHKSEMHRSLSSNDDNPHQTEYSHGSPEITSPLSAETRRHSQQQQYNLQNRKINSPLVSPVSIQDSVGNPTNNIRDLPSNNNVILPSSNNHPPKNIPIPSNRNVNNPIVSPTTLSPSYFNEEALNTAADKKQRPAFLKKIQLPEYLSFKANAEKNNVNDDRTDIDVAKLHQSPGIDSPTLQFAKKEKLSLNNIENAIYGELINPDMMSIGTNEAVAQVLREHQTPAQIIAQTNQGRKPIPENFKPKITERKDMTEPNEVNQVEKIDLSEKDLDILKPKKKIENIDTNPVNINIGQRKLNEPILNAKSNSLSIVETSPKPPIDNLVKGDFSGSTSEALQNTYEESTLQGNKDEPIYKNEPIQSIQPVAQKTFDYDNSNTQNLENYNQPDLTQDNNYVGQEQYQTEVDSVVQPLENQTYPDTQTYTDPNSTDPNVYPTDQQQYDTTQNYQQYDQQNYTEGQENAYQNYPTDPNYQTEYDPNTYNYNYDQQQQPQVDGTYPAYDPNQQYSEQDYNQQAYQDPNYTEQQYSEQGYSNDPNSTNQQYQYDYTQVSVPAEGYDQQQPASQEQQQPIENLLEPTQTQQQPEPIQSGTTAPASNPVDSVKKQKAVKPILTREKSVDSENKKKKRVNFVDSSDESSSKLQQQQQQQPVTTDESDFDFSSQ